MPQTKKLIVDSAYLPLSIIIVGIGNNKDEFEAMIELDGDEGLWDNQGRKAARDLVQFVPFYEFCEIIAGSTETPLFWPKTCWRNCPNS